jgi:hypothetical protein
VPAAAAISMISAAGTTGLEPVTPEARERATPGPF